MKELVNQFGRRVALGSVPVGSRFVRPGVSLFERKRKEIVEEKILPVLCGVRGRAELAAVAIGDRVFGVSGESFLLFLRQIKKLPG